MPLKLTTYYRGSDIPLLPGKNIFHSKELFMVYEATAGYRPLMIVGCIDDKPVIKLVAVMRKKSHRFSPFYIKKCEVYGTGEILSEEINKEAVFGEVLEHLTNEIRHKAFLIEFRNLENSLFGYKYFRKNHYFPINWLRVKNSLHSLKYPMARFSESRRRQIKKGLKNGAIVSEAVTEEEVLNFSRMLRKNYSSKIRKHFPGIDFFKLLVKLNAPTEIGKIFIVKYKDKVIGGSVCLYSGDDAYLWFSGGMKKTYIPQYPGVLAVWKALEYAYYKGYQHLEFMDVGLPFKKHGYREFVLRFGGKQSSTRRWFRFRSPVLNRFMEKVYV